MKTYEQILRADIRRAKDNLTKAKHNLHLAKLQLKAAIVLKKRHFNGIAKENRQRRHFKGIKEQHDKRAR